MTTPIPSDDEFARYVKQVAMVTPEQVEAAEQEQRRGFASGITVPMGELLVRQGAITPVQREGVEKRLAAKQAGGLHRLGPYHIVRKLGEGGMGAVYLAEDTAANRRQVALKVLPKRNATDAEFVSRFKREARSAIGLAHPNIVSAYAVGEDFGVHWYAMEFCQGESLDARLKRSGRLPWKEAVRVIGQIAAGLAHAHAQGIIHRDIKPANIVLGPDGVAKVLDFGLAKQLGGGQSLMTQTGVVMGTPHYIAPEQARGDKGLDGRADLYALGATFYHLLTGRTPFSGSNPAAVIMQHFDAELPDPRELAPDLPEGVVEVVRRLMAKRPQDRYRDGEALFADLDLLANGLPPAGAAMDPSLSSVARRRAVASGPDHHVTYLVSAVVLLALVAGWWSLRPARAQAPTSVAPAVSAPVPPPPTSPATAPVIIPLPPPPAREPVVASAPPTPAESPASVAPVPAGVGTIDLLPLIDPARDAVHGTWQWRDGAVVSDGSGSWEPGTGGARLALPYRPPEEYDFRIAFTKLSGRHCVTQVFVANNQAFAWIMGGWGNSVFAFESVDGMHGGEARNPTRVQRPACLTIGRRHEAVLRVRRDGATALLDGMEISRTPAAYRGMNSPPVYHLGRPGALGLASWEAPTAFHVVQVVERSGTGVKTR
jgi:serine/threonine protein kinase